MATFTYHQAVCCGVIELSNISALPTPAAVLREFSSSYFRNDGKPRSFIYFTGVIGEREKIYDTTWHANRSDDYGAALAAYITAEELGTVTEVPATKNHSGNMLKMWIWAPDWSKLAKLV